MFGNERVEIILYSEVLEPLSPRLLIPPVPYFILKLLPRIAKRVRRREKGKCVLGGLKALDLSAPI
jgi:hypothetical protein